MPRASTVGQAIPRTTPVRLAIAFLAVSIRDVVATITTLEGLSHRPNQVLDSHPGIVRIDVQTPAFEEAQFAKNDPHGNEQLIDADLPIVVAVAGTIPGHERRRPAADQPDRRLHDHSKGYRKRPKSYGPKPGRQSDVHGRRLIRALVKLQDKSLVQSPIRSGFYRSCASRCSNHEARKSGSDHAESPYCWIEYDPSDRPYALFLRPKPISKRTMNSAPRGTVQARCRVASDSFFRADASLSRSPLSLGFAPDRRARFD